MAHLACPCGNSIWNGNDGDEVQYYFVSLDLLRAHWSDEAFFSMCYDGTATEMWKCGICDRMMVFDDPAGPVSRYMERTHVTETDSFDGGDGFVPGICWNNLFFNEVDRSFTAAHDYRKAPDYDFFGEDGDKPLLTVQTMFQEVFGGSNGRYLNWWNALMSPSKLVLFSSSDPELRQPVKLWSSCQPHWVSQEDEAYRERVEDLAEKVLSLLEREPEGASASVNDVLAELSRTDATVENDINEPGSEFMFDLVGSVHARALAHGLVLDSSECGDMIIGLPSAVPFRVRHLE
jgi:hypothetical protein